MDCTRKRETDVTLIEKFPSLQCACTKLFFKKKLFTYRYANSLYYLWKRHQALSKGELEALQRSWEVSAVCVTEVTLLRLFYAFLNTCPLMIVQMYLFVQTEGSRTNLTEGN